MLTSTVRIRSYRRAQRGANLIEVLVAIVVLGVGMLAMVKMHAFIARDGGAVNSRAVASSLAQEKLDDLRNFKWVSTSSSNGEGCGNGIYCYSELVNPGTSQTIGGGTENPTTGQPYLYNGQALTIGNTQYTRTWAVNDLTTFKTITVTIAWTDPDGNAQSLSLSSAIAADDSSVITQNAGGAGGTPNPGPKVGYTPLGVPDVVPLQVGTNNGDNIYKETSKPLPDVSSKGYSVATRFSSVIYDNTTNKESTLNDFLTVSCTCQFAGSGQGYAASYFIANNASSSSPGTLAVQYPAQMITKQTGTAPTIKGDPQDPMCTQCCRDHHDSESPTASNATTALFDPFRPTGDYSAGDHKHYYYHDATNPGAGLDEVSPTAGNTYLESCRFLRVDGWYRLMQDWRLIETTVMPKDNYLVAGSTALTKYQSYIASVVKQQLTNDAAATSNPGSSTLATVSRSSLSTRDISNASAGLTQLMSRAVYVDQVYKASAPRTLDSSYYSYFTGTSSPDLTQAPYNEVNVTLLSAWNSSNTGVATVTNSTIQDINASTSDYYGTYSRGRAQVLSGSGGNSNITAYMLPSNSGLTGGSTQAVYTGATDYNSSLTASGTIAYAGEIGIDRDDHRSGNRQSDSLNISRASSSSSGTISGVIKSGNSSSTLTSLSATVSGGTCTVAGAVGGQSTFSCTVPDTSATVVTLSGAGTNLFVSGSATGSPVGTTCAVTWSGNAGTCSDLYVFGPYINVNGACAQTKNNSCSSSKVTLTATGTGASCTNGNSPACKVPLSTSAPYTWTGSITITTSANKGVVNIGAGTTAVTCTNLTTATASITTPYGPTDGFNVFNVCAP